MFGKRGISPVIATVLLLVITVVLVSVLAAFVIPFVNESIKGSGDCFKTLNKVTLAETEYACYVASPTRTGFSVKVGDVDIVGFKAILYAQGTSDPVDITEGATDSRLRMLTTSGFGTALEVPKKGGLKTYVANQVYTQIEIVPIMASGVCDKTGSIKLNPCTDNSAIANLTA